MWNRSFFFILFFSSSLSVSNAFVASNACSTSSPPRSVSATSPLPMTHKNYNNDGDENIPESYLNYLDDLTPPPLNLKRESILFSPSPSTKSDNEVLKLWKACKDTLPAVVTGVWPWRPTQVADENPVGALYNIAFVRMPVIGVGIFYIKHTLIQGHPLVMDMGQGPFEMSPLVVLSVLALVLA